MQQGQDQVQTQQKPREILSTKQLKKKYKKVFTQEPQKYYPTKTFEKYGFKEHICQKCGNLFYSMDPNATICGDSECIGKYTFLHPENPGNITPKQVLDIFREVFENLEENPHGYVPKYPIVPRHRNDANFICAGIQNFQPQCMNGEVQPPSNPLIQNQFCLRFNDLDSIGISGRHYSGFEMLGIQCFNYENHPLYWKDEIIEYNIKFIQKLGIKLEEVCFICDCWGGGGNLGPCIEYFVGGLELGDMVFTEFEVCNEGDQEIIPMKNKVIDVGIGFERLPWLLNGNVTSYIDTFREQLPIICKYTDLQMNDFTNEAWKKFGPYSCLLNVDECDDVHQTWIKISQMCEYNDVQEFRNQIQKCVDAYCVLDHLRTLLMAAHDGGLPGNVGGGYNLRNILRKVFQICEKNKWNELLKIDNLMELVNSEFESMQLLHYNGLKPVKCMKDLLQLEYTRYRTTDEQGKQKLQRLFGKAKEVTVDMWITAVTTYGIDPVTIQQITGLQVPENLYSAMDEQEELSKRKQQVKASNQDTQIINHETKCLYYEQQNCYMFESKLPNTKVLQVTEQQITSEDKKKQIVQCIVFDQTIFYPTSGGQQCDIGQIKINDIIVDIIDVQKVKNTVVHYFNNKQLFEQLKQLENQTLEVFMSINKEHRIQLMQHHTGAHIILAACKEVLGLHVWQNGAKKTYEQAQLDVTHYNSISYEQQMQIQRVCNRIISENHPVIIKDYYKTDAERQYGFTLYQGGVVPGKTVRVVKIDGCDQYLDAEACCGMHVSSTTQLQRLQILKTQRISDGVVRITYVCGNKAEEELQAQSDIIQQLKENWGVDQQNVLMTAEKFFSGYKLYSQQVTQLNKQLLQERMNHIQNGKLNQIIVQDAAPTYYLKETDQYLTNQDTEVIFIGGDFVVYIADKQKTEKFNTLIKALNIKPKVTDIKLKDKSIKLQRTLVVKLTQQQILAIKNYQ